MLTFRSFNGGPARPDFQHKPCEIQVLKRKLKRACMKEQQQQQQQSEPCIGPEGVCFFLIQSERD